MLFVLCCCGCSNFSRTRFTLREIPIDVNLPRGNFKGERIFLLLRDPSIEFPLKSRSRFDVFFSFRPTDVCEIRQVKNEIHLQK